MVVSQAVSQESICEGLSFRKLKMVFFFFHVRETDCHINFHKLSYLLFFFPLSIAILFMFLRMDNTSKIIIISSSLVVLVGNSVTLLVVSSS